MQTSVGVVTSGNTAGQTAVAVALGNLGTGATATVTYEMKVSLATPLEIKSVRTTGSVATAQTGTRSIDPLAVTPVVQTHDAPPALSATKSDTLALDADGDGKASPGDTLSYSVSVFNAGDGPAHDVVFDDMPGAYTSLVAGSVQADPSATIESGNGAADTSVLVRIGELMPGQSASISFQAGIDELFPVGVTFVQNQGTIASRELGTVATIDPDASAVGGATRTAVEPPPRTPTSVKITAPAPGDRVTQPTDVTAEILAPSGQHIASWCVHVAAEETAQRRQLACGTGTPPATLAKFDPTTLQNGPYSIEVSATATGGGSNTATTDVAVDGNLKPGRYTTTYQDLAVPIHSLPIQILRTYDSIDKQTRDFGVSWSLEIANFKVQTNGPLGSGGWSVQPSGCMSILGQSICLSKSFKRLSPHFVTVRWPDGRQEVFDFTPAAGADLYYDASAAFTGRSGTTSKLEVDGDPYIQYVNDGNIYNGDLTEHFNPKRFRLTAKDGTAYVIDASAGLQSATDRHGNYLRVTEDGVISSIGKSVTFTRDSQRRITRVTGPASETVNYAYDTAGDLTSVTDARNNTMRFTYDAAHNLLVTKDPQNRPMRTVTYDADGRMNSITDGAGHTTQIDTNLSDRQQVITSPDGRMTSVTSRDPRGNLTRLQETGGGLSRTSQFEYDSNDNQVKSIDPLGNVTLSAYDARSNLISTTDPLSRVTRFEYDGNDELVKTILPDGTIAQEITRDANGNPIEVDNGDGDVTTFTYDSKGRSTGATDALGRFLTVSYDANGNPIEYRDPNGLALTTTYDSANRPVTSTNALGAVTTNTYDAEGNLVSSTDPAGHSTSTTYDFAGRPLAKTDQRGRVMSYEYDAAGRMSRLTDKNGEQTTFTYDANGQLTRANSSDGTEAIHTFDALGRMTETVNNDARIEQNFDLNGRVSSITTTGVTGSPQPMTTASYEYDATGKTVAQTTSQGRTAFDYDVRDRLTSINDPQVGRVSFTYDTEDRLTSITRPNGVLTTFARNVVGDLTDIFHMKGLSTIDEAHYSYDALGQIATMTDRAGTHAYTYDSTGQLTAANHPGAQPDETFDYDPRGNRISGGETYDAANRLQADTGHFYAYDNEGNLTAKTDRITGATTTIEWDANQRQRAVTSPTGATTTYRYDPRGRRIEKSSPAGTSRYGYGLSSNPLVEYTADGSVAASFVFGRGSDRPLAMRRGGQSYFHLQDLLANVTALTDSTGTSVENYTYSAFGKQTSPTSSVGNPFTFAGRQWDAESATYYNRARQLDPNSGRFTSEDPIQSANSYLYAGNDPISSRDPSGLFSISELNVTNSIRGELVSEQIGFGMNLVGAIGGNGPSAKDMAIGAGGVLAGAGALKVIRTIRSIRAASRGPGLSGLERTGSALKTDPQHSFPDIVDNRATEGSRFNVPTKGPGGDVVRQSDLYQLEGSLNGQPGIFEWIVDGDKMTHRRFIPGGTVTGYPNQRP